MVHIGKKAGENAIVASFEAYFCLFCLTLWHKTEEYGKQDT